MLFTYRQMTKSSIKSNREVVKYFWSKGHRNAAEIAKKTGVPLRSCERYVSLLRKNGQLPVIHRPGRPRKASPKKRRQIGKIIKSNHFVTAAEIKTRLEETHPGFEIGK